LFNRIDRPLNHYGLNYAVVCCPCDPGRADSLPYRLFEWVGNSYVFNAMGLSPFTNGGLAGVRATSVREPVRTAVFADTSLMTPEPARGWHREKSAGYVALLDGHVEFHTATSVTKVAFTLDTVAPICAIPGMDTLNIGHSIISRAVLVGMERAVADMRAAIAAGAR